MRRDEGAARTQTNLAHVSERPGLVADLDGDQLHTRRHMYRNQSHSDDSVTSRPKELLDEIQLDGRETLGTPQKAGQMNTSAFVQTRARDVFLMNFIESPAGLY